MTFLQRTIKTSIRHIIRNGGLSIASISVIMLAFFLSTIFAGLMYGSNILLNYFETQAQVIAFFEVGTPEEDILAVEEKLNRYANLESTEYTSEEKALEEFREAYKDDAVVLESITEDVLPASLGVRAKKVDDIPQVLEILSDAKDEEEQIEEIFYREDVVNNIRRISKATRYAGIGLVAFLGTISFLIILITVGITISKYDREIEIMQLVGASNSYIRWPFVFTGAIYGGLGAIIAILAIGGLTYASYYYAESSGMILMVRGFFTGIPFPETNVVQVLKLIGAEVGIGVLIGAFSSSVAVRRYVR